MKPKKPFIYVILGLLFLLLLYSRFVNLRWGLPYPFHPDERNIANAIQNLTCHITIPGEGMATVNYWKECLNPKFFAYGQLTIYAGYLVVLVSRIFTHLTGPILFDEAIISLRLLAAASSVLTVLVALKIVKTLSDSFLLYLTAFILLIFTPAAIQFSHFGTTESFLMLTYTLLIYVCIRYLRGEINMGTFAGAGGFVVGLAAGAKISSLVFAFLPLSMFLFPRKRKEGVKHDFHLYVKEVGERALSLLMFGIAVGATTLLTSFYSFIDLKSAMSSLDYESAVALGTLDVFYTRVFAHTTPVAFQFISVFPFALGWLMMIFFMFGMVILPWKKEYIAMRLAFLLYFLPTAFTYTKWTRFMAPIFPVMILIGVFALFKIYEAGIAFIQENNRAKATLQSIQLFADSLFFSIMIMALMIPGLAYLTIYQTPDVRFKASEWIFKNVPSDAYILEETANVIDIPITPPYLKSTPPTNYEYISFNFYDVDADPSFPAQLQEHINKADYIFVPSRRIFANHTCLRKSAEVCQALRKRYPLLNNYYDALFSGELGFKEVAEFTSYPRIELFGKKILELPDEVAEETWTVFDHPVIRIYKRS